MQNILVAIVALASLLFTPSTFGQTGSATIYGTVADNSGGVFDGAPVKATNVSTGTILTAKTNRTGAYTFTSLPSGIYQVEAEMHGFQTGVFKDIQVGNAAQIRLNFKLAPQRVRSEVLNPSSAVQRENNDVSKSSSSSRSEEKVTVQWLDSETGKILFTNRDIVSFDWDQQIFELDSERVRYLMSLPLSCKRKFIIRDPNGTIYEGGTFSSGLSPCSFYDGPTIITQIYSNNNHGWLPLYKIQELEKVTDSPYGGLRLSNPKNFLLQVGPSLKALLEASGVFRSINKDEVKPLSGAAFE
jgi:hypothetical protein